MNQDIHAQIQAYADGDMSAEDSKIFEKLLAADPDLREDLDIYVALKADERKRLRQQLSQIAIADKLEPLQPKQGVLVWLKPMLRVAAVLLAVAVGWWWWPSANVQSLADEAMASKFPVPESVTMGGSTVPTDVADSVWQVAARLYNAAEYQTAATTLDAVPDLKGNRRLLRGICHLYAGNYPQAIADLSATNDPKWQEAADWYCALAAIKAKNTPLAREKLQALAAAGNRQTEAQKLLKALQ